MAGQKLGQVGWNLDDLNFCPVDGEFTQKPMGNSQRFLSRARACGKWYVRKNPALSLVAEWGMDKRQGEI